MTARDQCDYVIVGGGSAGCVLANRLSADPHVSVCLLEAGPEDRHPYIHIPIGFVGLFRHPVLNWRYEGAPQPETGNRAIYAARGKVLGGTSAINGMVYMRGHPTDYDDWAAAGNDGWSFAELLPYFKRSENNLAWRNSPFHGIGGPLTVMDHVRPNGMSRVLIEAAQALQFPFNPDFNRGEHQEGFGIRQVTQKRGRRQSTATAFLDPVRSRRNLEIVTSCSANRILIRDGRAIGVEVRRGDRTDRILAAREVIVAAGTVNSPLLLMRSGIGDGEELRANGIEPVRHLPGVGRNMQDHSCIGIDVSAPRSPSYGISLGALPRLALGLFDYLFARRGILASNIVEAGGFVRTDPSLTRPNLSFTFMSARRNPNGKMGHGHGYALIPQLLRPKSRGRVALAGPAPEAGPWIDPGCLKDERDLEELLQGLKLARSLLDTPAFRRYGGAEELPGAQIVTDDQLRDYIRNHCATAFHAVGTCRMGRDAAAVVDPALRVHGIAGLRVVDASIMPEIIGGNTNAPTIMIAEKASDMILGRPAPPPQWDR